MSVEIGNYIEAISTLFVAISAYMVYWQIKKSHEWNKKKTGEEALTRLSDGDLLKNFDYIKRDIGWSVLDDDTTYKEIVEKLDKDKDKEKKIKLDYYLTSIFRHLETTTIKIDHEIIDEDICFDYLFDVLIKLVDKNKYFIVKAREDRKQPKLYEHVEKYAARWKQKIER